MNHVKIKDIFSKDAKRKKGGRIKTPPSYLCAIRSTGIISVASSMGGTSEGYNSSQVFLSLVCLSGN